MLGGDAWDDSELVKRWDESMAMFRVRSSISPCLIDSPFFSYLPPWCGRASEICALFFLCPCCMIHSLGDAQEGLENCGAH